MIITRKITQIGASSFGIVLPKEFLSSNALKKGDVVKFDITVEDVMRSNGGRVIRSYRCPVCQYHFDTDDDDQDLECPSCGCIDVQEISEYLGEKI